MRISPEPATGQLLTPGPGRLTPLAAERVESRYLLSTLAM